MFNIFSKNNKEATMKIVQMGKHPNYNFNVVLGLKYISSVYVTIDKETKTITMLPITSSNEKYWRQGYGTALVQAVINCAKENGCTKIVSTLDEAILNNGKERIINFCKKNNFTIIENDSSINLELYL